MVILSHFSLRAMPGARKQGFDAIAQQPAPKLLVVPHPRLHRLSKITGQCHG